MREIHRDAYTALLWDAEQSLVVFERHEPRFPSVKELMKNSQRMDLALLPVPRRRSVLLIDARQGPAQNDPEFDDAFEQYRKRLEVDFTKVAVLVKTAVGLVQVTRLSQSSFSRAKGFLSLDKAAQHLGVTLDEKMFPG